MSELKLKPCPSCSANALANYYGLLVCDACYEIADNPYSEVGKLIEPEVPSWVRRIIKIVLGDAA
jgi:hypothetical protein